MSTSWTVAQSWEASWWGNCANTYGEEEKQLVYAQRMGLRFFHDGRSPYNLDLQGQSVLDIGGGPCSLLLKCVDNARNRRCVWEPMELPAWVTARYHAAGISVVRARGEDLSRPHVDEAWIYNVLQHCEDPRKVIENARQAARLIRLFEWIDTPQNEGHPNSLSEAGLNEWLGGEGKAELLKLPTLKGKAYYGIFPCWRKE